MFMFTYKFIISLCVCVQFYIIYYILYIIYYILYIIYFILYIIYFILYIIYYIFNGRIKITIYACCFCSILISYKTQHSIMGPFTLHSYSIVTRNVIQHIILCRISDCAIIIICFHIANIEIIR